MRSPLVIKEIGKQQRTAFWIVLLLDDSFGGVPRVPTENDHGGPVEAMLRHRQGVEM